MFFLRIFIFFFSFHFLFRFYFLLIKQRQIAIDTSTTKTTRNPDFAKHIIKLALNQTSANQLADVNQNGKSTVAAAAGASINIDDIEKNKKDVASLNSDLQLLSSLLGRPVAQKDISQLTKSGGTGLTQSSIATTKTTVNPAQLAQEVIQQIGGDKSPSEAGGDNDLTSTDELASIDPSDAYGKTNDALLATLLKQRGIGPAHNNLPLDIYSTTTTVRPRLQSPSRSPRPLLDGLSWLWKTWQDTSPGNGGYQPQSSRTRTRGANSETVPIMTDTIDDPGNSFDDGLDPDISSVCLICCCFCYAYELFPFEKKILIVDSSPLSNPFEHTFLEWK